MLALEPRVVLEEAAARVEPAAVATLAAELAGKSLRFQALLAPASLGAFGPDERERLLNSIFAARRRRAAIEAALEPAALAGLLAALLDARAPLAARFSAFVAALPDAGPAACDLASECLHYTTPLRHGLWAAWVWDARTGSGALPIALQRELVIEATDPGARYLAVTAALADLATPDGPFALDAYLALLYAVYARATTRMKMSDEFNRAIPRVPELARRLLGIHRATD